MRVSIKNHAFLSAINGIHSLLQCSKALKHIADTSTQSDTLVGGTHTDAGHVKQMPKLEQFLTQKQDVSERSDSLKLKNKFHLLPTQRFPMPPPLAVHK